MLYSAPDLSSFFEENTPLRGLPSEAYTQDDFWHAERHTVFAKNWVCIGFVHDLRNVGDAVPVTIAGHPLVAVMNRTGKIRVFHNVCRHRCLALVDQPKNVGKLIRCPYHAWAYDLDGRLCAAPHFGGADSQEPGGLDLTENGLVPVRTRIWHDWIFVNIDGAAEPFDDYAASMIARLGGIEWDRVECIGKLDFGEIACNWKFIMENFIEPYHVQFVHSSTTDQPLQDHYTIVDGNCLGSAVDLEEESQDADSLAVSSRYLTLYPNFILGRYFPDQMGVYLNIPTGPGTVLQKRALYVTEGQTLPDGKIAELKKLWWDVHKEDHEMTERLHLGRSSIIAKDGGVLSPAWEDSVRAFQEKIAHDVVGINSSEREGQA